MENKSQEYLEEVMNLFLSRFAPVEMISDSTHFLSTGEIHQEIIKLNPGCLVKAEQVYDLLKGAGFHYEIDDNRFSLSIKWMLRRK